MATISARARLYQALEDPGSALYRLATRLVLGLILLSLAVLGVETMPEVYGPYRLAVEVLDWVVVALFSVEYLVRVYAAPRRLRYVFSWWGLIDLLSILPSFASLLGLGALSGLRELRVLRVLRVLKLAKMGTARMLAASEREAQGRSTLVLDLQIFLTIVFTVVFVASSLAYYAERNVPSTKFTSIPASLWWGVVAVTLTGYGDMLPHTLAGRLVASVTMVSALVIFGLIPSVVGRALNSWMLGSAPPAADASASVPVVRRGLLRQLLHDAFVETRSRLYLVISVVMTGLVFVSLGLVVVESLDWVQEAYQAQLDALEHVILAAFALEYVLRIIAAPRKLRYIFSFWGLVDLAAILPGVVTLVARASNAQLSSLRALRALRTLRTLRVLKLTQTAGQRVQDARQRGHTTLWLDLQIYLVVLLSTIVLSASLVFEAERGGWDTFYTDMLVSLWWALATVTKTGYGDLTPVTVPGRLVAGVTMLMSLVLFGMLTSTIVRALRSSAFGALAGRAMQRTEQAGQAGQARQAEPAGDEAWALGD